MDQSELQRAFSVSAAGPAYRRLAHALAETIRRGSLAAGTPLPTERVLAETLSLSRVTVRSAYRQLADDGFIDIKPGSGNYVRAGRQVVEQPLWLLSSFSDDMTKRGRLHATRLLELTRGQASAKERDALSLVPEAEVVRMTRLRLSEGRPLAIETAVLPEALVRDAHLGEGSLYAELARLGVAPIRGQQRMRAVELSASIADLLGTADGSAGMLIERITLLPDGRPVEYTTSHYRGDAYDFVAQLDAGDLR